MSKARSARELGAARNVIVAYLAFAGDNNGRLLPGIVEDASLIGLPEAVDRAGDHRRLLEQVKQTAQELLTDQETKPKRRRRSK